MSSYLNIYGIPKEGDKPIEIVSFSRSHCVYRAICDEINIAWAGNSDVYTNLTTEMIDQVVRSIEEDLKSCTSRLQIYEKYASKTGSVYHTSKDCPSLKARNPEVKKISLSDARKQGYKACKRCRKN